MNSYAQLELLRDFVGESVKAHWSSLNLLRRLNMAQRKYERIISMTAGDWLLKSASVTATASVITLPSDCGKPVYLENSDGTPLTWLAGGVTYRRISRTTGATIEQYGTNEIYPLAKTIEINSASYSGTCTLWYQQRVPDLHCGFALTGSGASALVFDTSTDEDVSSSDLGTGLAIKFADDYYNGVNVEVIDGTSGIVDIVSEISDYTASSATAVITGTAAEDDKYGTVSVLPEECHHLMVLEATVLSLIKPGSKLDKEALQYYRDELRKETKIFEQWLETRVAGPNYLAMGELD